MLILQIWQFDWDPNVQSIPIHTILKNKRTRGFYLAPTQIPSCDGGSPSLGKKYCRKHKLKSTPDFKTSHVYFSENLTIDCVQIFYKKTFSKKHESNPNKHPLLSFFARGPFFYVQQLDLLLSYPKPDKELIVWKIDNRSFLLKAICEFL